MRVNIDEIKELGLERAWDVTREQLDDVVKGDPAGYRAAAPARVTARLDKLARRIRFRGATRAELVCPCRRCLATVAMAIPVEFELSLVPDDDRPEQAEPRQGGGHDRGEGPAGGSFSPQDADEERYRGKIVDLDPILREQILLALPAYPVCRDGCPGLCPACGQNLNERDCGCDRRVPDPRWAELGKIRRH